MMAEPANIDEYISFQNDSAKVMLAKMRQIINAVAKDADEIISYNMPALKYKGRILVYYAGFQNHCSLFPANSSLIADLKEELKNYKTSKGTIQFDFNKPLPITLINKIVKIRMKQNEAKQAAKRKK